MSGDKFLREMVALETMMPVKPAKTLVEMLAEADAKKANGPWLPACGGTETPFKTRMGVRLLYCYQSSTGRHAYLNCETDLILSDDEAMMALGY